MQTCLGCGQIFDHKILKIKSPCPIPSCDGTIEDIDEGILYAIHLLNQKEYDTNSSGAGSIWGDDTYIIFSDAVHEKSFGSLPKHFNSKILSDGRLRIFKEFVHGRPKLERLKFLMNTSMDLLEWAEKLPQSTFLHIMFNLVDGLKKTELEKLCAEKLHLFNPMLTPPNTSLPPVNYGIVISPADVTALAEKILSFAKEQGVQVTFNKID